MYFTVIVTATPCSAWLLRVQGQGVNSGLFQSCRIFLSLFTLELIPLPLLLPVHTTSEPLVKTFLWLIAKIFKLN